MDSNLYRFFFLFFKNLMSFLYAVWEVNFKNLSESLMQTYYHGQKSDSTIVHIEAWLQK